MAKMFQLLRADEIECRVGQTGQNYAAKHSKALQKQWLNNGQGKWRNDRWK